MPEDILIFNSGVQVCTLRPPSNVHHYNADSDDTTMREMNPKIESDFIMVRPHDTQQLLCLPNVAL